MARGTLGIAAGGASHGPDEGGAALVRALDAQRAVVVRMRDAARIGGALAERLATEVDVDALRVSGDVSRLTGAEDG